MSTCISETAVIAPLIPTDDFSACSFRMLALRETVLHAWERHVRSGLASARKLSRPVLIDTMPVLYERLCSVLSPAYFVRDGVDVASIGQEHGVERANLSDYDAEGILTEFQMFRSVLFDVLDAHDVPLTAPERRTLHLTIDSAVRESVRAFVAATNSLRERFAGALAHDLRQPASNMVLGAKLILRLEPTPQNAQWADRIVKNGERMSTMLNELLDALAIQSGDRIALALAEFDMLDLARSVTDRARDYQGANVHLNGHGVIGWWNEAALERALENLVSNAQKYGDAGKPIEVNVGDSNGRLIVSVRNQGKPIPPGELDAIFQQFVRSSDAGVSTTASWGLGLPYVRSVTQSHGGSVVVYSDANDGTSFVIDIPVDARPFQQG
jgi:signal transduction histidine kinase